MVGEYHRVDDSDDSPPSASPSRARSAGIASTRRRAWLLAAAGATLLLAFGSAGAVKGTEKGGQLYESMWKQRVGRPMNRLAKLESLYGLGEYEGRSWIDHIESLDDEVRPSLDWLMCVKLMREAQGLAPATKWTQRWIYNHQNPPLEECSDKLFYVMGLGEGAYDTWHGLGSAIHLIGASLRSAIDSGAILAWDEAPLGKLFVEDACRYDGVRSLDCLFEPVTHCPRSSMKRTMSGGVFVHPKEIGGDMNSVPTVFVEKLREVMPFEFTPGALKYWWSALFPRARRCGRH